MQIWVSSASIIPGGSHLQSMSRKGNGYDNADVDHLLGQLKTEAHYGEHFESVYEMAATPRAHVCKPTGVDAE